ncbi:MAG: DJ-1/PfpI family protein [Chthoniobacterales bacterium]
MHASEAHSKKLLIGGIIFPEVDQLDFTGPFEVLSEIPNSKFLVIAKTLHSIKDMKGLILTPEITFAEAPQVDVLLIPGGRGINELMSDPETLSFIKKQASHATWIITVCTGSLLLGATGYFHEEKSQRYHTTTHWASHHLLSLLGASPQRQRVVQDGKLISAAGVTSGIDAALLLVSLMCGEKKAMETTLSIEYDPQPLFHTGIPEKAPNDVVEKVTKEFAPMIRKREKAIRDLLSQKTSDLKS